jgi:hypothetical protein
MYSDCTILTIVGTCRYYTDPTASALSGSISESEWFLGSPLLRVVGIISEEIGKN